ncbi:MAG: YifB family Mg chelatase-like AAA ATPase, partial [Rickettsiaceae bacterium]|nr:YifB family Mg chelatase-like AAA ATPase [Rickettsiaceae bacterium]
SWSGMSKIVPAKNILSIVNHFKGLQVISPPAAPQINLQEDKGDLDFADIIGQAHAKKALEVAAAGGHNVLMYGPPGTGKSMLASRIASILPEMSIKEILECSTIYSVAGMIQEGMLNYRRPYRAPHHSCSSAAMVGGGAGKRVKPGEISLAHNGVLFLDELPEFAPNVIEALRQPIETGEVLISRSNAHIKFPAKFQLIAAMNPCRCGYFPNPAKSCSKAPKCSSDYFGRISGPMMDRFDIRVEAEDINASKYNILKNNNQETSKDILARVKAARKIQEKRLEGYGIATNSQLNGQVLIDEATPDNEGLNLLNDAAGKMSMSMRSYNKILKVARTIADLEGVSNVRKVHVAEAISFRSIIRNF